MGLGEAGMNDNNRAGCTLQWHDVSCPLLGTVAPALLVCRREILYPANWTQDSYGGRESVVRCNIACSL